MQEASTSAWLCTGTTERGRESFRGLREERKDESIVNEIERQIVNVSERQIVPAAM
jgi:hypothetical protein